MKKIILTILILCFTLIPLFTMAELLNLDSLSNDTTTQVTTLNKLYLNWSSDTYVPYDYQGRNLPVKGSTVTINAYLNVSGGNIQGLKYSWFLDDVFQENKSGYGRSSFEFTVRRNGGSSHNILLKIFNDDRSFYVDRTIEIPITQSEVIIYPSDGNSHFSNQTSTTAIILSNKRFSFIAKPYFFSVKKLTDLIFEWNIAGKDPLISSDYDASIFNLTVSGNKSNDTTQNNVDVNVKNRNNSYQKAFQSMIISIY